MTKLIEGHQVKRIHTLLTKTGLSRHKDEILSGFISDGRAIASSKELYWEEANRVIKFLVSKTEPPAGDAMRKKIISCFREMSYIKDGKADMARINAWVVKYGYLHKPLMKYTALELPKLVSQAEAVRDSFLKGI